MRDVTLNAHYIFTFKNPRDRSQIVHLAWQISPDNWRQVHSAYEHATGQPYHYLLFDLKQSTPDALRLRSQLIDGCINDGCAYVYGCEDEHEMENQLNSAAHSAVDS